MPSIQHQYYPDKLRHALTMMFCDREGPIDRIYAARVRREGLGHGAKQCLYNKELK